MRWLSVTVLAVVAILFTSNLLPIGISVSFAQKGKQEPVLPPPLAVEKSMHEFMEYYFEPAYLRLKAAMAAKEKDKKAWKEIKANSLVLAEGANLLLQRLPEKDGKDWANHAFAVREAGSQLYQSVKKKDDAVALSAYRTMIAKCNACHKQFEEGKHKLEP